MQTEKNHPWQICPDVCKYKTSSCMKVETMFLSKELKKTLLCLDLKQNDLDEIGVEIQQYTSMVESGCSTRLSFLLCGAFMPFCIHGPSQDQPYVVPCREVCQQVQHDCRRQFHDAWGGLPWPSKLHCHRYPSHTSNYLQDDNTTVPCSMPPVGF